MHVVEGMFRDLPALLCGRGRDHAFGLAMIEDPDVLVSLQGSQDVLHAVSQIDDRRVQGNLLAYSGDVVHVVRRNPSSKSGANRPNSS